MASVNRILIVLRPEEAITEKDDERYKICDMAPAPFRSATGA
jgi:hypothetical protein